MTRVVVSGSHGTGKTTLIGDLTAHLPGYVVVEEPYHRMVAEGHEFAAVPDAADFESLTERAIAAIAAHDAPNVLFDRGPVDYLAYAAAVSRDTVGTMSEWLPRVREALDSIDLVVFLPIEAPDRTGTSAEARRLRRQTHALLHALLIEDAWALHASAVAVVGSPTQRVGRVLELLR